MCQSVGLIHEEFRSKAKQDDNTLAVIEPRLPCYLSTHLPSLARYVRLRKWSGPCVRSAQLLGAKCPGHNKQKDREANTNAQG